MFDFCGYVTLELYHMNISSVIIFFLQRTVEISTFNLSVIISIYAPHVHLVHNAIENEMVQFDSTELKIKEALELITKKINSLALFKIFLMNQINSISCSNWDLHMVFGTVYEWLKCDQKVSVSSHSITCNNEQLWK